MSPFAAIVLVLSLFAADAVDLEFENPESGFFLRQDDTRSSTVDPTISFDLGLAGPDGEAILDLKHFTVLEPSKPVLVRASYGPFSTKQTVPARYLLPEFADEDTANLTVLPPTHTHRLEVSAHLVASEVSKARPTVRVLIHGAGAKGHHSPHICVTVMVRKGADSLSSSCTPTGAGETGGDATCLVSLTLPTRWWPPHTRATFKVPRTVVQVSYMVGTATGPTECQSGSRSRVTVQPETSIGEVQLTLDPAVYEELSSDPLVHILVPSAPLYPGTVVHAPMFLHPPGNLPTVAFVMRCKVRGGLLVNGVEATSTTWNLTVEFNERRNSALVTAILSDAVPDNDQLQVLGLNEVLSWALEVAPDALAGEARVSWSLRYIQDVKRHETFPGAQGVEPRRITAKLNILKDDTQTVLPIAKSWSVVNTAVLTGRQVSRAMKVLIVSQAGKVADVTLQSSCTCTDEAALKVTASCTSVYLDGSEVRGSHNATVVARYGERYGTAAFTVWMPEVPLFVNVEDIRLSQIRGWKVPRPPMGHPFATKLQARGPNEREATVQEISEEDCVIRYQQTPVEVYGKFVAVDDNSGRESYLLSRQTQVKVTGLVSHLLRVADTSVAELDGSILRGKSPGRTEIQVLSPVTGRVIGSREIKVGSDSVWVSRLQASVISGLTLSLQPNSRSDGGFLAVTAVTSALTAKYQEGLVDVSVELSDGMSMPLKDVPLDHYSLKVRSLDPNVVAVAPSPRTSQPRVIAVGHGEGDLLQVSLDLLEECEKSRASLASTVLKVKVDLGALNLRMQFDETAKKSDNETMEAHDKIRVSELPHADAAVPQGSFSFAEKSHHPAVQARLYPSQPTKVTPLEVGMYVLLAVFGFAIVIFAASCVIYTYRIQGGNINRSLNYGSHPNDYGPQESVTNAHDWVWLGRATLERASGIGASSAQMPLSDLNGNSPHSRREHYRLSKDYERNRVNITSNPGAETEPLLDNVHNDENSSEDFHLRNASTFTKSSSKSGRRVTFNNLSRDRSKSNLAGSIDCPPVPPHRNIGVTANVYNDQARGNFCSDLEPPPIPPHGMNVIANPMEGHYPPSRMVSQNVLLNFQMQQQHHCVLPTTHIQQQDDAANSKEDELESDIKFVEVNADDFVRLRGITRSRAAQVRRATILENPLLSANIPDNLNIPDHLENLPPAMDYEQLMEYFSNLKESNA